MDTCEGWLVDVREKLVELLENHCAVIGEDHCKASQSGECAQRDCAICLASDLIANGVTVQEWIPVTERLPDTEDVFLCWSKDLADMTFCYTSDFKQMEVTHWMPMPQPPKGE